MKYNTSWVQVYEWDEYEAEHIAITLHTYWGSKTGLDWHCGHIISCVACKCHSNAGQWIRHSTLLQRISNMDLLGTTTCQNQLTPLIQICVGLKGGYNLEGFSLFFNLWVCFGFCFRDRAACITMTAPHRNILVHQLEYQCQCWRHNLFKVIHYMMVEEHKWLPKPHERHSRDIQPRTFNRIHCRGVTAKARNVL